MKSSRMLVVVTMACLWPGMFSLALAQSSSTPATAIAPYPSAQPRPAPPSAAKLITIGRGATPSATEVHLNQNTLLTIWNSEAQMNNYYVNVFIRSAGSFAAAGGSMLSGVPTMTLEPSLRLVIGQGVKLNGENITAIEAYRVEKLELIGIAKHETPVAFTINRHSAFVPLDPANFARGNNLRPEAPATPTEIRPLTDFEKNALTEIKTGQDVVSQPEADGTRIVVGAVRAQAACVQCHSSYKVGDALGSFSYHLSPANIFGN